MSYVDGFVAAVPTQNRQAYKEFVEKGADYFKKLGALSFVECWGDDVPDGEVTSFPMAVKKQEDETIVFSWIIWPSKEVRDNGHHQMQQDSGMEDFMKDMPFDGKRMIFGGFVPIVEKALA